MFPNIRMKIHIVGAGPTGLSLAWEILRSGNHEVTIYDKKISAGGSWWEPDEEVRDLHAHRLLFGSFVNTKSLFNEMNIKWDDMFKVTDKKQYISYFLNSLSLKDYGTLIALFIKVTMSSAKYRSVPLKDALGELSENGRECIKHLPLIMDGVTWDVMSAYDFIKNLDHVGFSKSYTQRVSGKVMCDAMENAVLEAGADFVFSVDLIDIQYEPDSFSARFTNGLVIDEGMLFLCVDNSAALKLIGDNWGSDANRQIAESTYGAINVILDYEDPINIKTDLEIAATTKWNIQPKVLSDGKTVSCVICNLTEEIMTTDPDTLKTEILKQLNFPEPLDIRIGWGAEWKNDKWEFSQSSGVLSLHGQVPFFGNCEKVALCGMMSPRDTPYSSIEAAVEVSRSLSNQIFNTREPKKPPLLSNIIIFILVLLIVLILVYLNRNL